MYDKIHAPIEGIEFMGELVDEQDIDRETLLNSDEAQAHFMAHEDVWDGEKMVTQEEMDAQLRDEEK